MAQQSQDTESTFEEITDADVLPNDPPEKKYEYMVVDVGAVPGTRIHAWGDDHAETIGHAAHALYDYMITDMSKVVVKNKWSFKLNSSSIEVLVNDFLSKLHTFFDTDQFIGKKICINDVTTNHASHEFSLSATIYGECFDAARHERGKEFQCINSLSLTFRSKDFEHGDNPEKGNSDLLVTLVN
jgi:SHS2 domain-containing protein